MQARIDLARFYSEQILPQVAGLSPAIAAGAEQLFAITGDELD